MDGGGGLLTGIFWRYPAIELWLKPGLKLIKNDKDYLSVIYGVRFVKKKKNMI